MNTVEQTEYKSKRQLPIIILLLILFAFKYYSSQEGSNSKEGEKINYQQELNDGMVTSGTDDMLIQPSIPMN